MAVERKYERDVDLLLAEELAVNPSFADGLKAMTGFAAETASVVDFHVSKGNELGESDLIAVFARPDGTRFALLVEDKVDAPLQPEQASRYRSRAARDVSEGIYAQFEVLLCAPRFYVESRPPSEFEGFDRLIPLEALAAILRDKGDARSVYRASFLENAASKRVNAWSRLADEGTDAFWDRVHDIAVREFPTLEMKPPKLTKDSAWITFRPRFMPTKPKWTYVAFKGDRGHIDLTFSNVEAARFQLSVAHLLDPDMTVHQTSASSVVRLVVSGFSVPAGIASEEEKVRAALSASERLVTFYRSNRGALDAAATASSSR
jgi:hypothetical protein